LKDIFSLKNIELNFTSCQTTDRALMSINKALSSLKELKTLSLNMRNSDKLSDLAVNNLNETLGKLNKLESCFLRFRGCKWLSPKMTTEL